ncbi:hypothetical protein SprV_0100145500 [Sparganum proliferum]
MGTQHFSPGNMACADAGIEVTMSNKLIHFRHSCQERMQVLVEFLPRLATTGHIRGVDADDGGEIASPERQAEAHQAIAGPLRQTGQSSHNVVPKGKGDARVLSLCPEETAPE